MSAPFSKSSPARRLTVDTLCESLGLFTTLSVHRHHRTSGGRHLPAEGRARLNPNVARVSVPRHAQASRRWLRASVRPSTVDPTEARNAKNQIAVGESGRRALDFRHTGGEDSLAFATGRLVGLRPGSGLRVRRTRPTLRAWYAVSSAENQLQLCYAGCSSKVCCPRFFNTEAVELTDGPKPAAPSRRTGGEKFQQAAGRIFLWPRSHNRSRKMDRGGPVAPGKANCTQ